MQVQTVNNANLKVNETLNQVSRYTFKDERLTNLFDLTISDLTPIFEKINARYQQIENSEFPGKGYEFYVEMISKNKRPLKFVLDVCKGREKEAELEMPKPKENNECAFCKTKSIFTVPDGVKLIAKIIKSLEGNPLTVSGNHAEHFFKLDLTDQIELTLMAITALSTYTGSGCSRAQLSTHIGIHGHQTFPHAHMHITSSLGFVKPPLDLIEDV